MPKPYRYEEIEQEYGESMGKLLIRKLNELGSMEKVAAALGVSYPTVFAWCKELGIMKRSQYVLPEQEHAS